jgi:phage terminase small subunit
MARGGSRPNAGRKRKAPELKRLAGTLRKDRDPVPAGLPAPVPAGNGDRTDDLPDAPVGSRAADLQRLAALLEKQGRAAPEYAQHVALVALRLEQVQRYQAVIEVEGDTYETRTASGGRMVRARPEVALLSDAMRQAQSLIGELMLNPSAALRIASGHKPTAGAFDDF